MYVCKFLTWDIVHFNVDTLFYYLHDTITRSDMPHGVETLNLIQRWPCGSWNKMQFREFSRPTHPHTHTHTHTHTYAHAYMHAPTQPHTHTRADLQLLSSPYTYWRYFLTHHSSWFHILKFRSWKFCVFLHVKWIVLHSYLQCYNVMVKICIFGNNMPYMCGHFKLESTRIDEMYMFL